MTVSQSPPSASTPQVDLDRALVVRPIRYTASYRSWLAPVAVLGGQLLVDEGPWHLYALAGGLLALHDLPADDSDVGTTDLGLVVADLDGYAADRATGTSVERITTQAGPALRWRAADGLVLDVMRDTVRLAPTRAHREATPASEPAVSVCPLWMTPDVAGGSATLRTLGLVPRLSSDAGQWSDLLAPGGGLIGVHADDTDTTTSVVLSFETDDADALAARFAERGLRAHIVDESYGRSLRFDDPDGGVELWVNETITDLYGYRRA